MARNRIGHLGRQLHWYETDIFHWYITVDDQHLLGPDGEKQVFSSMREAKTAGFAFVLALTEDESHYE
jgi:hypothetical protein